MSDDDGARFGLTDAELAELPTVFAEGSLAGSVALVSGGGGGLGRATGWLLGRLGAEVVLVGRDGAKLDAAAAAMVERGLKVTARPVDIRDVDAVAGLFAKVATETGVPDLVVNSAGGQFPQAAIDFAPRGWNAVINTNLTGTWNMMQAAARAWRDAGRPGSIVNVVVVPRGLYGVAHTVAARSGVIGLSQALAVEWAPLGIRVNCLAPGAIETPGWRVYDPRMVAQYPRSNPMMRSGTAWEVAEACVWLGGPGASYVTGEVLHVAGGAQVWGEVWTIERPDHFDG